MDDLVKEVIPLLQYLIPGFFTAWIFYSLTAFKRPDTFGQIVQALIFTFVIHLIVNLAETIFMFIGSKGLVLGRWDQTAITIWSFLTAVSLGLLSCYSATSDNLHSLLRKINFTRQTSSPCEWYSAFARHERFVVLHLLDERRLYGWPLEWPSEPAHGQFVIQDPCWLTEKGEESFGAEFFVIDVSKVSWVEFAAN